MRTWILATVLSAAFPLAALVSHAQTVQPRTLAPKVEVPRGHKPPAGMCRIWIDNVPARQQPAPTDCANAIRNRPPNGRVIFSEEDDRKAQTKGSNDKSREKKPKKPDGNSGN